jgi:hypothetical protein
VVVNEDQPEAYGGYDEDAPGPKVLKYIIKKTCCDYGKYF